MPQSFTYTVKTGHKWVFMEKEIDGRDGETRGREAGVGVGPG